MSCSHEPNVNGPSDNKRIKQKLLSEFLQENHIKDIHQAMFQSQRQKEKVILND